VYTPIIREEKVYYNTNAYTETKQYKKGLCFGNPFQFNKETEPY